MSVSEPLLAPGAAPAFFAEVAVLLVASALVAYLCHRLRVTPIASFLLTGTLIGPHALGLVRDEALIEAVAEIGVVLLLFSIGIEFSLGRLARIQRLIFAGGGLQVGLTLAAVTGLLLAFGVDWRAGIFTGCLIALSSTALVMNVLMSRGETDTRSGHAIVGILIFQDLAVVAMVLVVPMLGGAGRSAAAIPWALAKAVVIVALVLVAARRVMPRVLEAVARTCSPEIFMLTVMATCFGTAYLTSLAGVSLSLGAFLAGLLVSESRFSALAFGDIQPLQILFSAAFFVSVGLLLNLEYVLLNLPLVLALLAGVLLVKAACAALSLRFLGYGLGTALFSGLLLAQVGEFSFVLERTGRAVGLFPGGVAAGGPESFLAATVILMMATPLLAGLGTRLERGLASRRLRSGREPEPATPPSEAGSHDAAAGLAGHVVIAGYGKGARALAQALDDRGLPHLILTLSPEGAREAEQQGRRVLRGNYARRHELSLASLGRARLLVVADDEPGMTRRVVRAVRSMNPELPILARTRFESDAAALHQEGVHQVVAEDQASASQLVEDVLRELAAPRTRGPIQVRLSEEQRTSRKCSHLDLTRDVSFASRVCESCVAQGDSWVHLRICMSCGNVGCCDDSKNRHATAHFHATDHPIVKSLEPGEDWAWCYRDSTLL